MRFSALLIFLLLGHSALGQEPLKIPRIPENYFTQEEILARAKVEDERFEREIKAEAERQFHRDLRRGSFKVYVSWGGIGGDKNVMGFLGKDTNLIKGFRRVVIGNGGCVWHEKDVKRWRIGQIYTDMLLSHLRRNGT